jgi:hypothetical protein
MQENFPQPNEKDVEWAYLLWNSMTIGGEWTLPSVGVYVRTGETEMTLTEIHFSKPNEESLSSVFDQHHWIMILADLIGWKIEEKVERAFDYDLEVNIPDEMLGDVFVCSSRCGAMFRVEPLSTGVNYTLIDDEATCPCCGDVNAVDEALKGVHVVLDDTGWVLKQARIAQKKIIEEE